ncbi:hypothetical protein QYF61_017031 [Mycteria americana]|uniref:Uncharacterized protein n=1 Tax=Mycteria americana TaxID=33587 RepID=A0AAN7SD41_MYCAM|nr:hypothetical protein QYF61_017031 [Mycteria americana]
METYPVTAQEEVQLWSFFIPSISAISESEKGRCRIGLQRALHQQGKAQTEKWKVLAELWKRSLTGEATWQGSLRRAEQPQLSQPVLVGEVLQPSDHFCGPPLDPLQQLHVLLVLRAPELDAVLQVGSQQSRVEGQNHLPRPAGHASFDAAQDTVGLLGCKRTLSAHVQLFIHQYPQVLFRRAALDHIIPQPVLKLRIALTQVQDLALGLVEPQEVHTGPLLQLVQVCLDGIPSFYRVNCTTQLGVICKLAEGALNLAVNKLKYSNIRT